jgi:CRP-like cAMP-binding protein
MTFIFFILQLSFTVRPKPQRLSKVMGRRLGVIGQTIWHELQMLPIHSPYICHLDDRKKRFCTVGLTTLSRAPARWQRHVYQHLGKHQMQILPELSQPFVNACAAIDRVKTVDLKSKHSIYLSRPEGKTYVIKRGYVRLSYLDSSGRLLTRMLLGKGAVFGDLPFRPGFFISEERATTSGMACLLELRREAIEQHSNSNSQFQALLLQTIASQYTSLDRRMQWQLITPLKNRVAAALFDLICFAGGRCGHGHLIDVRLTHEEFAELIGAARPVVSEVLADFKARGFIDYTRGYICILNFDDLQTASRDRTDA